MKVDELIYHPVAGVEDFEDVVSVGEGGGYDWDQLEAWWSPSRRKFFWISGSGCSCNYLGENVGRIEDFEAGERDALLAAVRAWHEREYPHSTPDQVLADLAKVAAFTPATN
ncbi:MULTISPECIES: hypothetical protein [unclassified Cryobacterium]|uniref:DUF7574 domain-containing protein n=1 Tax=unclassified Cryobacterium TaxID=2649013 RepID=UPI002AB3E81A|nr:MULTISPECIES: hypothetical protein [unclassified Cryobacterium]MDY7542649.1 hypothetical protein [Cryobacterium sp. 5B3]MEB0264770.1 hypothetical protein [Cryobacterium sp. 10I5]MEB0273742.1 hypothetical protein [Cryobacterium sp. 5B3]